MSDPAPAPETFRQWLRRGVVRETKLGLTGVERVDLDALFAAAAIHQRAGGNALHPPVFTPSGVWTGTTTTTRL